MKNKKGFTLIELLAVIAILAILVVFAVPNIIKMFGDSKKKAFVTQAQSVFDAAESEIIARQFKNPGTSINRFYSENASDRLSLSKSDNLKYCIKVENGKVKSIAVVDGSYWYINDDISKISDIDTSDSDKFGTGDRMISCSSTGEAELDSENPVISIGDTKKYGSEEFYVVSTNSTTTALLAKYNLLVGDRFYWVEEDAAVADHITYTSSDPGYGLQNIIAKGYRYGGYYDNGAYNLVGLVPFSGTNYWDNQVCQYSFATMRTTCTGTAGLNSNYSSGGAKYSGNPYPKVYNSSMSSVAPSLDYTNSFGLGVTQNNEYTIAYYVEQYMTRLTSMGIPNGSNGRLMYLEEMVALGCSKVDASNYNCSSAPNWLVDSTYWLGSARNKIGVFGIIDGKATVDTYYGYGLSYYCGVRPVIEIPTSSFFES